MRKSRITIPSQQQIDAMYESGDIEQMREINERLAKVANQRFKQLEKSGMTHTTAYTRSKYFLSEVSEVSNGETFSRSKKISAEDLHEQLSEIRVFLTDETSTVSGEKARRQDKMFDTMTKGTGEKGFKLDLPEDIKLPPDYVGTPNDYFKKKFLQFLDEDAWSEIKKYKYTEDGSVLQQAGEAIAKGAKISDLKNAYEQYLRKEVSIYEMWDSWTKV